MKTSKFLASLLFMLFFCLILTQFSCNTTKRIREIKEEIVRKCISGEWVEASPVDLIGEGLVCAKNFSTGENGECSGDEFQDAIVVLAGLVEYRGKIKIDFTGKYRRRDIQHDHLICDDSDSDIDCTIDCQPTYNASKMKVGWEIHVSALDIADTETEKLAADFSSNYEEHLCTNDNWFILKKNHLPYTSCIMRDFNLPDLRENLELELQNFQPDFSCE